MNGKYDPDTTPLAAFPRTATRFRHPDKDSTVMSFRAGVSMNDMPLSFSSRNLYRDVAEKWVGIAEGIADNDYRKKWVDRLRRELQTQWPTCLVTCRPETWSLYNIANAAAYLSERWSPSTSLIPPIIDTASDIWNRIQSEIDAALRKAVFSRWALYGIMGLFAYTLITDAARRVNRKYI